jgi:hypothetical protein
MKKLCLVKEDSEWKTSRKNPAKTARICLKDKGLE